MLIAFEVFCHRMRNLFLAFFLTVIRYSGFCQTGDSVRIFQSDTLVRGLYKNYQEFLYNSPSYKTQFTALAKVVNKKDSSIMAARPAFPKGEKTPMDIWGFCTGDEVFVKYNGMSSETYYWKLESIGAYSYFAASPEKYLVVLPMPVPAMPGVLVMSTGKSQTDNSFLLVIDTKGKIRRPDFTLMKKFLKPHPTLLKSFKEAAAPYEEYEYGNRREDEAADTQDKIVGIIKSYLDKLNEELKNQK
jgi:hypothetical protein